MELQDFHSLLEGITGEQVNEAENAYNELLQNDRISLLQLLVTSISTFNDKTVSCAIILLGRAAKILGQEFINIGDESFHTSFQASLLSLIESNITDTKLVPLLSNTISTFASVYQSSKWPDLCISLLQYIYQSEGGIVTPPSTCPLSSFLATDILWQCINNESILLNQEDIFQYILTILETIFQEPTIVKSNQLVSTIKLTLSIYMKTQLDQQNLILHFSTPIVEIIPQLPQESVDDYIGALSLFSDSNILFFSESIESFVPILMTLINDFHTVSDITRIRSIYMLKKIIMNEKYATIILPKSYEIYQLFLTVISNSTFELDPFMGLQKPCTMTITEDAIETLSEYFSEEDVDFPINVSALFQECLNGDFDFDYVVANLIGYSNCVKNDASNLYFNIISDVSLIYPVFQATLSNQDPKLRVIAVESLNSIMKNFGEYISEFNASEFITIIADTISKETDETILTYLIKSLKIYVTKFTDFGPYCDNLMELLGSLFDQMNEKQQILTLKCYYKISTFLGEKFDHYMSPILSFIENLFSSYNSEDKHFPIDLFFVCMDLAPRFSCLPQSDFDSISQAILTIISSIGDFSELSSKQMDYVNGSICSILKRNRSLIVPFANEIVNSIMTMAMSEIECTSFQYDSNSEEDFKYGEDIVKFNSKTNMYDVYSNSSINNICEALNTLKCLLQYIDEIVTMESFFTNIVQVIMKNLDNCRISKNEQIFYLINYFFRSARKNDMMNELFQPQSEEDNHPIIFNIYSQQLAIISQLFMQTNDLQSFSNCDSYLKQLETSFLFVCKAFYKLQNDDSKIFVEMLNQTIALIVFILSKTYYIRANASRITDFGDDFKGITEVETITGSFFGIIFNFMSPLISSEMITSFCTGIFLIQPKEVKKSEKMFVSSIVFDFWLYYLLLYPGSTQEQADQIVGQLRDLILENKITIESSQNCLSTMLKIACGFEEQVEEREGDNNNRYGYVSQIDITLQFLSAFFENFKETANIYSGHVNKELIIVAYKLFKNQQDPSVPLQILVSLMPIVMITQDYSFGDEDDVELSLSNSVSNFAQRAADYLIEFVQNKDLEVVQQDDGIATMVVMASLMYRQIRYKISSIKRLDVNEKENLGENLKQTADNLTAFVASVIDGSQFMESITELYNKGDVKRDDVLDTIKYAYSKKK